MATLKGTTSVCSRNRCCVLVLLCVFVQCSVFILALLSETCAPPPALMLAGK